MRAQIKAAAVSARLSEKFRSMRRGVRPWPSPQIEAPTCHILALPLGGNTEDMSQNPKDITESIDVGFSLKACLQP